MKQYEAVAQVMRQNGGYATFRYLDEHALKVEGSTWGTKTPFASIRRIVQTHPWFFRIRPGLWGLKEFENQLPEHILPTILTDDSKRQQYNHSYYQGILLEIGRLENFNTYIPSQDKNKPFLGGNLKDLATLNECPNFTFPNIIQRVKTIDVMWFNQNGFPKFVYEVEHSTDMLNSLTKFVELVEFQTHFYIVADATRRAEYQQKIQREAFQMIRQRTKFLDYEQVSVLHENIAKKSQAQWY
jgi:hypothetical protein